MYIEYRHKKPDKMKKFLYLLKYLFVDIESAER